MDDERIDGDTIFHEELDDVTLDQRGLRL